jgi:formyl-CoA transferase
MAQFEPEAKGPLSDVRVLDLSRLIAGNTLTLLLADFGADVIKVEPFAGDTLRAWKQSGVDTNWKLYGRNKRSLAIDFRHGRTRDLLLRLAAGAHVFVESFRPGTLEAMGLPPDELLRANPRLVIVRVSAWGQDGPYARRPGFGTLVEGMSGFAAMNGYADREPLLPPAYLADSVAGLYGAAAVLIALREVEANGGGGQVIDLPLIDPLFAILGPQAAAYRLKGEAPPRTGNRSTVASPRNAYRTKDGRWVCLSGSTQGMTERLFRAMGRPELIDDARFRTNADRLKHPDELDEVIGGFIAQRTQAENVAFFEAAEVAVGPMYDIADILQDPHFRARRLVEDYPDADMGTFPMNAIVPRLARTPGAIRAAAPRLGEHSREVLASFGVSDSEIDALVESGAVAAGEMIASSEAAE